jgi:methylglyoxal synthase
VTEPRHGQIALITTPEYRNREPYLVGKFIYQHLYNLCQHFRVLATGRTFTFIEALVNLDFDSDLFNGFPTPAAHNKFEKLKSRARSLIAEGAPFVRNDSDLNLWRAPILEGLQPLPSGIEGMILITFELIQGTMDAVIHLTDWSDVVGKPDSMVLRREANVHDVPIASDYDTAKSFVRAWNSSIIRGLPVFRARDRRSDPLGPLEKLSESQQVLGLIAHDEKKLDLCCFFVENARTIFADFEYVLSTGTTGLWLQRFVQAAGGGRHQTERIIRCVTGPEGGDVQIAAAVVKKKCQKVIFLQDPLTAHPHETDIRLFEQTMLFQRTAFRSHLELATNLESARAMLGLGR